MATTRNLPKVPHIVGSGSSAVIIALPDVYGSIGSAVGVNKLTGARPDGASGATVRSAMRDGSVIKVRISYMEGTKRRTSDILCSVDDIKTALSILPGKTYASQTVKTAYFPRRMRLG
jgi:hypothetical protein